MRAASVALLLLLAGACAAARPQTPAPPAADDPALRAARETARRAGLFPDGSPAAGDGALTRYDLALSVARAVDRLSPSATAPPPDPDALAALGDLAEAVGTELTALGTDMEAVRKRLTDAAERAEKLSPPGIRPITHAGNVIAVYTGGGKEGLRLVVAFWGDGTVLWSRDRSRGGPPYRQGKESPERFRALIQSAVDRKAFTDLTLRAASVAADSPHLVLYLRNGSRRLQLRVPVTANDAGSDKPDSVEGAAPAAESNRRLRAFWAETRSDLAPLTRTQPNAVVRGELEPLRGGAVQWRFAEQPPAARTGSTPP